MRRPVQRRGQLGAGIADRGVHLQLRQKQTAGKIGSGQLRIPEVRAEEIGRLQVGVRQVGGDEIGAPETRAAEIGGAAVQSSRLSYRALHPRPARLSASSSVIGQWSLPSTPASMPASRTKGASLSEARK